MTVSVTPASEKGKSWSAQDITKTPAKSITVTRKARAAKAPKVAKTAETAQADLLNGRALDASALDDTLDDSSSAEALKVLEALKAVDPTKVLEALSNLDSHGPDAARLIEESPDPALVEARLTLADLINNPPRGSVVMTIDQPMAQAMRERNIANRSLREARVKDAEGIIRRREWMNNGQPLCFSTQGVMLNGQHRIEAIWRVGIPVEIDVRFGLDPESFKTMDTGMPRTVAHVLGIRGHVNTSTIAAGARLMFRYEQEPRMGKINSASPAQIEAVLERHPDLIEGSRRAFVMMRNAKLPSSVTTFVWALAAEFDRAKAAAFFDKLENGLKITDKKDPVWRLRSLLGNKPKERRGDEIAAVTIKAFNAFVQGRGINHLRWVGDGSAPEAFPEIVSRETISATNKEAAKAA
jgi:hypothetical protein